MYKKTRFDSVEYLDIIVGDIQVRDSVQNFGIHKIYLIFLEEREGKALDMDEV